jgi:dTMP kinase
LLQAGYIVLADRYLYTAMVRDAARNCPVDWVTGNYSFAPTPDLALYYRTPLEVSLKRILRGRPSLKWHEAGMDLGLSQDPLESFRICQGRLQKYYDELAEAGYLTPLDATRSVHTLQKATRALFSQNIDLGQFERSRP